MKTPFSKGQASGSRSGTPELKAEETPQYIDTMLKEIVVIEDHDSVKTPEEVANLYLTSYHDLPILLPKTRGFFERILVETGSIKVSHKPRDRYNWAFSTVKILKIFSPSDWDSDLRKHHNFDNLNMFPRAYNYFDYINAWEKFMFYQNDRFSHSWFFHPKLPKDVKLANFPAWFQSWFYYWGPVAEYFPQRLSDAFEKYFQASPTLNINQAMLTFCFLNDIPWIFNWSYVINQHSGSGVYRLLRQASIKWWPKFDDSKIPDLPKPTTNVKGFDESQQKLKTALRGIARSDILEFLRTHSDTEHMEDSDDDFDPTGGQYDNYTPFGGVDATQDPFGGECSQTQ